MADTKRTKRRITQLKGHAFSHTNQCGWDNSRMLRYGVCECGAESANFTSRLAVQNWHREHKALISAGQ